MIKPTHQGMHCSVPEGALLPDVCIPTQGQGQPWTGERRLLQAVLQSALHDLAVYGPHVQDSLAAAYYVRQAERWLGGQWHTKGFDSDWLLEALGLSPSAVRRAVLGGKDKS